MAKCKIHPAYQGKRKPTSKKKGCTCMEVYEEVQSRLKTHDELMKEIQADIERAKKQVRKVSKNLKKEEPKVEKPKTKPRTKMTPEPKITKEKVTGMDIDDISFSQPLYQIEKLLHVEPTENAHKLPPIEMAKWLIKKFNLFIGFTNLYVYKDFFKSPSKTGRKHKALFIVQFTSYLCEHGFDGFLPNETMEYIEQQEEYDLLTVLTMLAFVKPDFLSEKVQEME